MMNLPFRPASETALTPTLGLALPSQRKENDYQLFLSGFENCTDYSKLPSKQRFVSLILHIACLRETVWRLEPNKNHRGYLGVKRFMNYPSSYCIFCGVKTVDFILATSPLICYYQIFTTTLTYLKRALTLTKLSHTWRLDVNLMLLTNIN